MIPTDWGVSEYDPESYIMMLSRLTGGGVFAPSKEIAWMIILLKPTGYVMHQQFNIQQLYALSTLYLCVLYLSENKQRLLPLTA